MAVVSASRSNESKLVQWLRDAATTFNASPVKINLTAPQLDRPATSSFASLRGLRAFAVNPNRQPADSSPQSKIVNLQSSIFNRQSHRRSTETRPRLLAPQKPRRKSHGMFTTRKWSAGTPPRASHDPAPRVSGVAPSSPPAPANAGAHGCSPCGLLLRVSLPAAAA